MTQNNEQIQALKAAAEKAIWGDWEDYKPHKGARGYEVKKGITAVAQHCLKDDAAYIAKASPKVILSLLAEREADKSMIAEQDARLIEYARIATENAARTLTVKLPLMLSGSPHFNGGVKSMFKHFKQACDEQGITLVVGGE